MINKKGRRDSAVLHTAEMERKYNNEIKASVEGTCFYKGLGESGYEIKSRSSFESILFGGDSVSAIFKYKRLNGTGRIAVLNFASNNHPGGGYIRGSMAQEEEALCTESFLYNVLLEKSSIYDWAHRNSKRGLYSNWLMYTPDVIFTRSTMMPVRCDVITSPSPNWGVARDNGYTEDDNIKALRERILGIAIAANKHKVDTIILGAYGCGVFKQDPKVVATIFKDIFSKYMPVKNAIYAIPKESRNLNYKIFKQVFEG